MTSLGPGDPETWPPATGHANDPRYSEEYCPECDDVIGSCAECGDELELLRADIDRLERSVKYLNGELGRMRRYRDAVDQYTVTLSLIAKYSNSEGMVDMPDLPQLPVWRAARWGLVEGSRILKGEDHE